MAKLTSLDDLRSLLPEGAGDPGSDNETTKRGYDGRPQQLSVRLDSKRRRGKRVTLITGFQSSPDELKEIETELKKQCGAGGQVLDNEIEIQGDHREKVVAKLKGMGFTVRSL